LTEVSVVIPTHERGSFVREAVHSALTQGVNAEVIVVRSRGDTAAEGLRDDFPRITLLECEGERGAARNAGCRVAAGVWVLFLDDDDVLLPGALSTLVAAAGAQRADVVRGSRVEFDSAVGPPAVSPSAIPNTRRLERDALIIGAEILTPSQTLFRRAALPDGPFREDFVPVEDYALGATLALRGARVMATDATTTAYRRHAGQSVGYPLDPRALQRRRAVLDELNRHLTHERRLRCRARGHHELYARMPTELSIGHRSRAITAVLSAAVWSPSLLRHSMWWRGAAHAAVRGSRA
jgi:GT2 family glycosyltransferase